MDELGKIDLLRERLGVSYKIAKDALDQAGGDVVQALIILEQAEKQKETDKKWDVRLEEKVSQLADYIREIINKGNVTKVRLKKEGKVVFEIPATIGVIGVGGALLHPLLTVLAAVGTVAALVSQYTLEIVREDGKVVEQDLKFLTNKPEEEDNKED